MSEQWWSVVRSGDAAAVHDLLEAGQPVDAKDRYGQTALMLAALHGDGWMVDVLLEHAPDLDHTAKYGLSALMLACIGGHLYVVEQLLEAGADTTITGAGAPGFAGLTARDLAEQQNHLAVAARFDRASP